MITPDATTWRMLIAVVPSDSNSPVEVISASISKGALLLLPELGLMADKSRVLR